MTSNRLWTGTGIGWFNASKTKLLSINHHRDPSLPPIRMSDAQLHERSSLRLLGLKLSIDLRWNKYIESIASSTARKVGSLCHARKFFSSESSLQIYNQPFAFAWSIAAIYELESLLFSLSHRRAVASLCPFYKYFHGNCSDEVFSLVPRLHEFKRSSRLASRSHPFTVETVKCSRFFYTNSFMSRTSRLWNSLPCFSDSYNPQLFKCNVSRCLDLSPILLFILSSSTPTCSRSNSL
ncbi:unnamed protein product [Acanthosepion pharaonis]|uniref:Uncharacterized protein n=1 Tax=Acanthosepion pharaonis TaxID=158019 RepID=A0A812DDC6_ACAPH|nr:unnamed protein product [Sepia pharaonis]